MNKKQQRTNIYLPTDSGLAFLLALILPQILIIIVMAVLGKEAASSTVASALVPQIGFLIAFFVVSERSKVNYKTANQFNFKINIWSLLCVLVIGLIAIFGFSPLINMFDAITSSWGYKSAVANLDVSTLPKLLTTILYVALLPAICEELIFRGIITNGLKKFGTRAAVILSAVLFALIHQNLQQLVYQLFLGGVMAYIALKTGSIIYTMLLHFFNNAFVLLLQFLGSGSSNGAVSYDNAWSIIWPILLAIASSAAVLGLLALLNFIQKKMEATAKLKQNNSVEPQKTSAEGWDNIQIENKSNEQSVEETLLAQKQENVITQQPKQKFYTNPVLIAAIATGVLFWIFAVISSFKG